MSLCKLKPQFPVSFSWQECFQPFELHTVHDVKVKGLETADNTGTDTLRDQTPSVIVNVSQPGVELMGASGFVSHCLNYRWAVYTVAVLILFNLCQQCKITKVFYLDSCLPAVSTLEALLILCSISWQSAKPPASHPLKFGLKKTKLCLGKGFKLHIILILWCKSHAYMRSSTQAWRPPQVTCTLRKCFWPTEWLKWSLFGFYLLYVAHINRSPVQQ